MGCWSLRMRKAIFDACGGSCRARKLKPATTKLEDVPSMRNEKRKQCRLSTSGFPRGEQV